MRLRGQISKDQLIFEVEIEKVAKNNRKLKAKENQEGNREDFSTTSSFSNHIFQEESNMATEGAQPPRELLETTPHNKDPKIFLALQYLQLTGPWR